MTRDRLAAVISAIEAAFAAVSDALAPVREPFEPVAEAAVTVVEDHDSVKVALTLLFVYVLFIALLWSANPDNRLSAIVRGLRVATFFAFTYALLALALNLHWGYAGLFNIGIAGFMAVGVYTMAMLTGDPQPLATGSPPGLGLPLWIGVIGGTIAASIIGLVAALPALRLRADYFAIVTLGLSEIIRLTYQSSSFDRLLRDTLGVGTGGGSGFTIDVGPNDPITELILEGGSAGSPTVIGEFLFTFTEGYTLDLLVFSVEVDIARTLVPQWFYVLFLGFAVLAFYVFLTRLGRSPYGRVLKAIREDELVARSLGKNTDIAKIKVFMIGCALMGLGGILWQGSQGFVSPTPQFLPVITFYIFVAMMLGGAGSNTGSIIGGIIFGAVLFEGPRRIGQLIKGRIQGETPSHFIDAVGPMASGDIGPFLVFFGDNIAPVQFMMLGAILIALMLYKPEGILGHRIEEAAAVDLQERTGRSAYRERESER